MDLRHRFRHFVSNKTKTNLNIDSHKIRYPDHVITIHDKDFAAFLKKYPFSVIDFWAPWCVPCKTMSSRLRRLSKIFNGQIAFGKINVETNKKTAKVYKISGIPHLILFYNGKVSSHIHGLKSTGTLKDLIYSFLEKHKAT